MDWTIKQTADFLMESDRITILCHRKPDGDALGSGFALYYALSALGKQARVLCSDGYPDLYRGILYEEYTPGRFEEETVISVDLASEPLLGTLRGEYEGRIYLAIDHHGSNTHYAENTCLQADRAAAAELIYEIIREMGVPVTEQIALCIYTGITTDTGCFRFSNTNGKTMRIAAELLDGGLDPQRVIVPLFESKSPARVAFESLLMSRIRYYYEGKCAVVAVDAPTQDRFCLADYDLEGLPTISREITGVYAGLTIRERDGECRVSLRTMPPMDASAVCAHFGGGGHLRAAGCIIRGSIAEAEEKLVAVIGSYLPKN